MYRICEHSLTEANIWLIPGPQLISAISFYEERWALVSEIKKIYVGDMTTLVTARLGRKPE